MLACVALASEGFWCAASVVYRAGQLGLTVHWPPNVQAGVARQLCGDDVPGRRVRAPRPRPSQIVLEGHEDLEDHQVRKI